MKFLRFINSKVTVATTFFVSIFAAMVNFSMMHSFVFIDMALFDGFCLTLSILFLLSVILNFAMAVCKFRGVRYQGQLVADGKFYRVSVCVNLAFTILFVVLDIVNLILNGEALYTIWLNFLEIAPLAMAAVLVLTLVFFFPAVKDKKCKIVVASLLCGVIFLYGVLSIFPISIYRLESAPMVVDNGEGYSIVFATTEQGTGYVEYAYEGKEYKIFEQIDGKKNSSKIHTVQVPYEHLDGNSYTVGSTRVVQELSYGGRLGNTITSDRYTFNAPSGELKILSISDWHTHNSQVYKSVEYLGDYNAVILLGDSVAGLEHQEEVIEYIIKPGGKLTGGAMPILWVRGNHETRGSIAKELADYLGMDKFYYTAKLGDVNFVVLDSAEDKVDTHPEYGGMNDFESYRRDMVDWLESLPNDMGKNIVLIHDVEICIEEDLQARTMAKFEDMGTALIVGGHTHVLEYDNSQAIKKFVDGGYNKGRFVASKLTIVGNDVSILAMNDKGAKVYDNTLVNLLGA
ncbi:MAG: metallophosphoesterase family protein [Christensenellales bacterium]